MVLLVRYYITSILKYPYRDFTTWLAPQFPVQRLLCWRGYTEMLHRQNPKITKPVRLPYATGKSASDLPMARMLAALQMNTGFRSSGSIKSFIGGGSSVAAWTTYSDCGSNRGPAQNMTHHHVVRLLPFLTPW
jgi:hypothetical protein